MELELTGEQRVLLDERNHLTHQSVEKYRQAGQITQTGLLFVKTLLNDRKTPRPIGEICRLVDKFLQRATNTSFKKSVKERGIAIPVQIEKREFFSSVAPEERDVFQGGELLPGDVVKVTLGIHIDGYTAQVSHTVVIPDAEENMGEEALEGSDADAICAAYLATESILAQLGLVLSSNHPRGGPQNVTGSVLKNIVEKIAKDFRVQIVPGTRIRRVRRFLAGQTETIHESDFKGIEWSEAYLESQAVKEANEDSSDWEDEHFEEFTVLPGEAWLVDIRMASTQDKKGVFKVKEFTGYGNVVAKPSIYSRDYNIKYNLRMPASRNLLTKVSNNLSVYPFKLSYISNNQSELNSARLGLSETVEHHIIVPHSPQTLNFVPIEALSGSATFTKEARRATYPVTCAREMSTILLVPGANSSSGFPEAIRLSGGNKSAAPSWVHSVYQIEDDNIKELLTIRKDKQLHGVSFQDVQPSKLETALTADNQGQLENQGVEEAMEMDI